MKTRVWEQLGSRDSRWHLESRMDTAVIVASDMAIISHDHLIRNFEAVEIA